MNIDLVPAFPFALIFLPIFGIMVFIATYAHFPKMEKRKRIMLSARNAIIVVLAVAVLVYFFLAIFFQSILLPSTFVVL